jgi:hypothetical protein
MATRRIAVTLIAVCLGAVPAARAQYLPCPPSQGPMPEPVPAAPAMPPPSQNGPAYPGPLDSRLAPHGPEDKLGLPPNIKTAFPETPEDDTSAGFYAGAGAMALMRQRLGHDPIAMRGPAPTFPRDEPDVRGRPDEPDAPLPPFPDIEGFPILPQGRPEIDQSDIHSEYAWGPRATIGWFWGPQAIEVTGFYLPETEGKVDKIEPGQLTAPFINPPAGFLGDGGLWFAADRITASFRSTMGNAEVNYRRWGIMYTQVETIFGIRYFDLFERLEIFTDKDGFTTRDIIGRADPTQQASYIVRTHSHLVGPQIGWEASTPLACWLQIGAKAKGCWGANFTDNHVILQRGDGLVGFDLRNHPTVFSHLYELGLFVDWFIWDRGRLHVGYDTMFVLHVPEAENEVSFDLSRQFAPFRQNGNIFYHGPVIEMQILW